ncbi:MAG: BamA/TamA family outer membrane protein [Rikenellaceae bacterium]
MKKFFLLAVIMFFISSALYSQDGIEIIKARKKQKHPKERYDPSKTVDTLTINGLDTLVSHETLRKDYKDIVALSKKDSVRYNGVVYTSGTLKQVLHKNHRDSIRAYKNWWISVLGGPSYTPEASLGIGGAALMTFLTDRNDPNLMRSFIPIGFNVSINGTFVLAGISCLYFNDNSFRIYSNYGFRLEPANFYGIGYKEADIEKNKDEVIYDKQTLYLRPVFLWDVWEKKLFLGPMLDITYNNGSGMPNNMESNPAVMKYGHRFVDIGVGFSAQYDTRNNESFPIKGIYAILKATAYPEFMGNKYSYGYISTEFRHYIQLFHRRSTLAYTIRLDNGIDNVPYSNLPTFGSPFDLRGYIMGKYRDQNMGYGMVEYRHMFGTREQYARRAFVSRLGAVAWFGAGSISDKMKNMTNWKTNYGIGFRYEIQPYKNFRLDIGRGTGKGNGWLVYFNMTEAF